MAVLTESPFYRQIVADVTREDLLAALDVKFGPVPQNVTERLRAISDVDRLKSLHRRAILAVSLAEFVVELGER